MNVASNAYHISPASINDEVAASVSVTDSGLSPPAGTSNTDPKTRYEQIRLSAEGRKLASASQDSPAEKTSESLSSNQSATPAQSAEADLSEEELRELRQLQKRDAEVRAHEQAHLAAAGQYAAGGPRFSYQVGPNGSRYAVGGEVPIDVGKERTPEETVAKMERVAQAALAPLNPSAADRRIAGRASVLSAQARREIQLESLKEPDQDQRSETPSSTTVGEPASSGSAAEPPTVSSDSSIASNSRHMVLRAYLAQSA